MLANITKNFSIITTCNDADKYMRVHETVVGEKPTLDAFGAVITIQHYNAFLQGLCNANSASCVNGPSCKVSKIHYKVNRFCCRCDFL